MKKNIALIFLAIVALLSSSLACALASPSASPADLPLTSLPTAAASPTPRPSPTPLPVNPISKNIENAEEPVFISGSIDFSSPFFVNSIAEPFVMLEDQAGFVKRDKDFEFRLESQIIGPVEILENGELRYYLSLPSVPQGTFVDVDQNDQEDQGVQVFAIAYWSNTWGDPFLEARDGTGWSTAYASTITDSENEYELSGGTLIVWAPDDQQQFPTGFGADSLLFTSDDPTASIPPGYNLVDLNEEPFRFHKETNPIIDLIEGEVATNDFSDLDYGDAFEAMFTKVSQEYPFTQEKHIDWPALQKEFFGSAEKAKNDNEFFKVVQALSQSIPDGHANVSFNPDVFYQEYGGGFGLLLTELSDGTVIATDVIADMPADQAGIQLGAEIIAWNQKPVSDAISDVNPGFGPYSTQHTHRIAQTNFLTRTNPQSEATVAFINPSETKKREATLKTAAEYETIFRLINEFNVDPMAAPIEGKVLEESGLGYIRLTTFSDDYQFMARLWEHYISILQEEQIPGVIIDLRKNGGGSLGLALDFAGFLFDEEFPLYQSAYYSHKSGKFEYSLDPATVQPAPLYYDGKIAVLIGPECVSACEGFADAPAQAGAPSWWVITQLRELLVRWDAVRYKLPGDISLQFPTGRPETLDGNLFIEGVGVQPDIIVPVTPESALGEVDAVLDAAIQALLDLLD